jgi:hypothetical protein
MYQTLWYSTQAHVLLVTVHVQASQITIHYWAHENVLSFISFLHFLCDHKLHGKMLKANRGIPFDANNFLEEMANGEM